MPQAQNRDEYDRMCRENTVIEGFGVETTQRVACPFCGSPGWMSYRILEVEDTMQRPHVCKECGRGAKAVITRKGGAIAFEIVQISGADQPEWLEPKMRRV